MNVKLKKILAIILSICLVFSGLTFFKGMETNAADKGDDTMNILFIGNSMTVGKKLIKPIWDLK